MNKIPGGVFYIARQMFLTDFWLDKPASWKIIWIYILGKVQHKSNGKHNRGEGFFNFTEEQKQIGIDITSDKIKKFLQFARRSSMIMTERSTRGMIIKVLKYNYYQDIDNYRSTAESTREAREKHERSTSVYNNDNNGNKEPPISPQPDVRDFHTEDFQKLKEQATEVLDYLNEKCNKHFPTKHEIIEPIMNRLSENGITVKECKLVIDIKLHDPFFQSRPAFLKPSVLYGKKFYEYLSQSPDEFKEKTSKSVHDKNEPKPY